MKFVSYNIQFGIGLDGKFDIPRIVEALEGANVIALQEVTRNFTKNGDADLPKAIADLMPSYYHAFGAGCSVDAGSEIVDGRAVMRNFEFGNMVLSRYPIMAARNILLPRTYTHDKVNMQRSALEALIQTPAGPLRFYSVHLDHRGPEERIAQIAYLKDRAIHYGIEGGAVSGGSEFDFPELPHTDDYLIMGDFNMQPEQPDYISMVGLKDLYYGRTARATHPVDAIDHLGKRLASDYTWEEPGKPEIRQYLDYAFMSGSLLPRLRDGGVDLAAIGSDHKPIWVELA
jgi:endonuclease/exonuclease/phosphatase family metal-dependent hydrolase